MQAYQQNIELRRRRLIVMKLDEVNLTVTIDDDSDYAVTLRRYLGQHKYLVYGAEGWMEQLLYAMPVKRIEPVALETSMEQDTV